MTSSVWECRRQFGSIATIHPYAKGKGPVLTFTAFGSCLSDNAEVPCSTALGRLFDEGWKSWSEDRDEEMMGILEILSWLGVSYRILQVLLFFACCAFVLGERESKRSVKLSGGYSPWGERYRSIAAVMMALSTLLLMITTYIGLQLSTRLSATLLGSIEYPSLNIRQAIQSRRNLPLLTGSIIGAIGLLYGTLWLSLRDRGITRSVSRI